MLADFEAWVDVVGFIVAALLTIMVLSYLIGDNLFFRLAVHLFIGVAAGYAGALAIREVLWPNLLVLVPSDGMEGFLTLFDQNWRDLIVSLMPWILGFLLLLKVSPTTARFGALPVAFLVGVGAAVVVGGSITGTLLPQTFQTIQSLSPGVVASRTGETGLVYVFNTLIVLVGTISTLLYFRFTTQPELGGLQQFLPSLDRYFSMPIIPLIGRLFICITFGVMYAGAISAAVLLLADRIQFLKNVFIAVLGG